MFDDTSPFDGTAAPVLQRTKGTAACGFKKRRDKTVLDRLHQSGSFKIRLPRLDPGQAPEAVLLNTAGGLTGGDKLSFEGKLDALVAEGIAADLEARGLLPGVEP